MIIEYWLGKKWILVPTAQELDLWHDSAKSKEMNVNTR
jgi:hypothetical protein